MTELVQSFSRIVSILIAFVGVCGTLYFVYGAFQYMSAGGNSSKAEQGKSAMVQAGVGVVLALVAFGVINTITSQIGDTAGAVQVQQVVGTDSQRLEQPRITSVEEQSKCMVIRFTEPVQVQNPGGLKLGTQGQGALELDGWTATSTALEMKFRVTSGKMPKGTIVTGFIFTEGATIKDSDGNNALYAFQPHTTQDELTGGC